MLYEGKKCALAFTLKDTYKMDDQLDENGSEDTKVVENLQVLD